MTTKTCSCPRYKTCGCEFEAAVKPLGAMFNKAIQSAAHDSSCARFECGQCSCSTRIAMDTLAEQVKSIIDAGRRLYDEA